MGWLDGIFGSSSDQPQTTKPTGLLSGLDPQTIGLLSGAAAMMERSGPSTRPVSFGQVLSSGLLTGLQGYQKAADYQSDLADKDELRKYRKSQMEQYDLKNTALKTQQSAIANLKAKMAQDPTYKPTPAELMEIDADAAFKQLGGGTVDFGLEPKIGLNPTTNKPAYFIQDKRGGTKWLDAGVPDSLKILPGNDYQGPTAVNTRDGSIRPLTPAGQPAPGAALGGMPNAGPNMAPPRSPIGGQPAPGGYPIDPSQQGDPFAPWNNITSPKEVDQFKARQFEQDNKRLDEIRKQVAQGRSVLGDLNRFGELNRQTETGSWLDMANLPTLDANKKEMQSITSRLAPNQRPEGSGSSSDRDMGLFLQSLPGIDKEGGVNANIRKQYETRFKNAEDLYRFQEAYLVNRGHLNGVDEAYERHQDSKKGKPNGLDLSKLTPEQQAYLRQQNPEAFEAGVANFAKTTSTANKPKSKAIKLDGGGSAFASLGPDGHYYVERGGKRYRVED